MLRAIWTLSLAALLLPGCSIGGNDIAEPLEAADLYRDYRAGLQDTWDATRAQLKSMKIKVQREKLLEDRGEIVAEGGVVVVEPHRSEKDHTRVHVRLTTFADKEAREKSVKILDGITRQLEVRGFDQGPDRGAAVKR